MKNSFYAFLTFGAIGLAMASCGHVQPATVATVAVPLPPGTFTPTLPLTPTLTPLPPFVAPPTATLSPLPKGIFDPFPKEFYDNTVKLSFGVILSGATIEEQVLVDSSIGNMRFTVFYRVGELDVTLTQPDGNLVNPSLAESDRYISFYSDSYHQEYWIFAPQPGVWSVRISGKSTPVTGSNYMLEASAVAATMISANFDQEKYFPGDPIKLSASIEDSISAAPRGPEYIFGATWQVIVEDPERTQYSFGLYDDGLHGDGEADDGVYANIFDKTFLAGEYNFYIQISGENNRGYKVPDGFEPPFTSFTRVYFRSTVVY